MICVFLVNFLLICDANFATRNARFSWQRLVYALEAVILGPSEERGEFTWEASNKGPWLFRVYIGDEILPRFFGGL